MARLSNEQALNLIKSPKNKDFIDAAKRQEERLAFHCEPVQETRHLPESAYRKFLEFAGRILPADKLKKFEALLTMPVDTVESTETIFDELSKIFEADDKYIKYEFVSSEIEADFIDYAEKINDMEFWPTKGFNAMKTQINSFIVVDVAAEQLSERPEPYYYLLSIFRVHDVDFDREGKLEYLIFRDGELKLFVFDEEFYRVYEKQRVEDEWLLSTENRHSLYDLNGQLIDGLGYVPADSFFKVPIAKSGHINNKGPLTNSLGKLDWLLFFKTSKKYLDTYGAWPIFVAYKAKCEYRDEQGNPCMDGFINYDEYVGESIIPRQHVCPSCSNKNAVGVGSLHFIDPPRDKEDADMMANPIKIIEMSNDKLTYAVEECDRLENEIYMDCVGWDGDALNKQAVNDTQVSANFESKQSVLDRLRKQIERAHKFAMDTVCKLRYKNYFINSTVDYGQEYFLQTPESLTNVYKLAKDAGLPTYIVSTLRDKINRTQNKNNPERLQRNEILEQLEPYPDLTLAQLQSMQIPVIDPLNFVLKLNFSTFIQRFEREEGNIVEFGSLIEFSTKINIIQKKLLEYANEKNPIPQPDSTRNAGTSV